MKKFYLILAALFLALVLVACGSDDSGDNEEASSSTGDADVAITASNWEFDQEEYTVPAGEVTVSLTNDEGMHGVEIEDTNILIEGDGEATDELEPGEYHIRCSIPCGEGHSDMTATLIVE
ncbi:MULTISPECIES: cupredoxin domain-containing protein [Gracilibacillus]|uniref:cytochrome C oxidase subunit II n=1 Tax=Gracilibacillus TaxID=74385 RepID=UPI000824A3A6|nr:MULTISPECIES: cytochrome C oxidase subunit II [Gracilibacillus]